MVMHASSGTIQLHAHVIGWDEAVPGGLASVAVSGLSGIRLSSCRN